MNLSPLKKFGNRRLPIWGDIPFRTRMVLLGTALTLTVLVLEALGALSPLEGWLYDTRALRCQHSNPPPTTQVVHLDIDDAALETVGKWPWPRRVMADVVDELREAGASALALDVIFSDEDRTGATGVLASTSTSATPGPLEAEADDAALATAIERFGKVVLPADFTTLGDRETELKRVIREQVRTDLELTPEDMAAWLKRFGGRKLRDTPLEVVQEKLLAARREVVLEKLLAAPNLPVEELLPRETRWGMMRTSPLMRLVDRERRRARAILVMEKLFPREVPVEVPGLLVASGELPPLEPLTRAIQRARRGGAGGMIGSVKTAEELVGRDGVIRSVPMLLNDRGHLIPQFGLALACMVLGVDPTNREEFAVTTDQIVLSPPGGHPLVIPIHTRRAGWGRPPVGACMPVAWYGGPEWQTMYDPARVAPLRHYPITLATAIAEKRESLAINAHSEAEAMKHVLMLREMAGLPPPDPKKPFATVADETLAESKRQVDEIRALPEAEVKKDEGLRNILAGADALTLLRTNTRALEGELARARTRLRDAVAGRAVIVGSTSSAASDMVRTSLHGNCPGVVVHGAIVTALLSGNLRTLAPTWLPYLIAALFGALMTLAVAKLTPWASTAVAVALALAYAAFNGLLLFDRFHVILGAAAPLSAIGLVWAGCTAASAGERFRINQLLHGYVDPKLVDYLTDHPENELFKTKTQEITVCFSDIQGFTTLTQQLGERMIPLLQDYLSRMVVVIRRHGGLVNKFMGDGIMFIFGVPERTGTAQHADAALRCCLEMQDALEQFNQEHVPQGFPALTMRVGVNTGVAYVGDAGPEDAREYTALGDTTNLAARLEPANKAFETRILVTETTYLQTLNSFIFVPVGKLQVRGRREGTMTYELLCRADQADDTCRDRAEAMRAVILSYQQGVFDGCLKLIDTLESKFGTTPACAIYRDLCQKYLTEGPPSDFHGQVRIG